LGKSCDDKGSCARSSLRAKLKTARPDGLSGGRAWLGRIGERKLKENSRTGKHHDEHEDGDTSRYNTTVDTAQ